MERVVNRVEHGLLVDSEVPVDAQISRLNRFISGAMSGTQSSKEPPSQTPGFDPSALKGIGDEARGDGSSNDSDLDDDNKIQPTFQPYYLLNKDSKEPPRALIATDAVQSLFWNINDAFTPTERGIIFSLMESVTLEWIANAGDRSVVLETTSILAQHQSDGADFLQFELAPQKTQPTNFLLDMFLVLKYPNMDQNTGQFIFQVEPVFTVAQNESDANRWLKASKSRIDQNVDLRDGFVTANESDLIPQSSCEQLNPQSNCPDDADNKDSNSTVGNSDNGSTAATANDGSGGGGGLSIGAKAGIGVGAGIGLLLLAGLIFFLFRRRRQRRAGVSGSGYEATTTRDGHPMGDYMVEKDVTGPHTAESPYSEDGGRGSALLAAHGGNQDAYQTESTRGFAPYSDSSPAPGGGAASTERSVDTRPPGARSITPDRAAVPATVAHLVEDGMTEEQIRRLEEEERALDQAIEQAGHSNRR